VWFNELPEKQVCGGLLNLRDMAAGTFEAQVIKVSASATFAVPTGVSTTYCERNDAY
jgi:hypothetical protein